MYDPWSLDLELPFAAKLKHESRRSIWETPEHLKGQVQGISHRFSLNFFLSYRPYLYSFWQGSNEQFLASFPPAPAIFTLYIQCLAISDKLHMLVSFGFTQNRWQVLVYYGSVALQMLFCHLGDALKLWLHWLVQNCDVTSQAVQALKTLQGCFWVLGPACSIVRTGLFMAGWCEWLNKVRGCWESGAT